MADEQRLESSLIKEISVTAFVGPAGTGKSLRAQSVAREISVDYLIDDGLVISNGRIVAGKSAKTEGNVVRAIRRAMFHFSDHRENVRSYLEDHAPCSIMIIGTSLGMVKKICVALDLPFPENIIEITDVATPEEISKAKYERYHKGQHVIPVSQAQVRRNFAGKLVGRLTSLWKSKDKHEGERTIVRPPFSFYGNLKIEPLAVYQIIHHIVNSLTQVKSVLDVKIKSTGDGLFVIISIEAIPGRQNLVQLSKIVKLRASIAVSYLTGVEVKKLNVNVEEVYIP